MNKTQLRLPIDELPVQPPEPSAWRPIHYLGSKLRLIEPLRMAIDQIDPNRGPVCDLFAGSGTVSAALASSRNVIAVDIQEYSRVLCSAILQPIGCNNIDARSFIGSALGSDHRERLGIAEHVIEFEQACLSEARKGNPEPICDLIEHASIVTSSSTPIHPSLAKAHKTTLERLAACQRDRSHETFVFRHFGGLYFSYQQAIELDSLLIAAHSERPELRDCLLAAIISSASEIVNTVGKHFAQPIRPRGSDGKPKRHLIGKILRDRELDLVSVFSTWLDRYRSLPKTQRNHRVICGDYVDALAKIDGRLGVVYADPPYTRDHYSRFYHVLETMCLWDEPRVSTTRIRSEGEKFSRGMYRVERHQSPFCIKSQAPSAFERLFAAVRDIQAPLVLSYSPYAADTKARPRVMTVEQISSTARRYFNRVEVASAGRFSHMKLNTTRLNTEASLDAELIFLCS